MILARFPFKHEPQLHTKNIPVVLPSRFKEFMSYNLTHKQTEITTIHINIYMIICLKHNANYRVSFWAWWDFRDDCTEFILYVAIKKLSLWNKIKYLNLNIFRTRCCKPLIFQTQIIWSYRIHSLKYLRSATFGSKDKVIGKLEFVAKTQFLF